MAKNDDKPKKMKRKAYEAELAKLADGVAARVDMTDRSFHGVTIPAGSPVLIVTGAAAEDGFGHAVSTAGDMNGDGVNDTFTQADINAGFVTYTDTDVNTTADSFSFTVSDGDGGAEETGEFVDVTLTLCQHVDQLGAAPVAQCLRHVGEGVEQFVLRRWVSHRTPSSSRCLKNSISASQHFGESKLTG